MSHETGDETADYLLDQLRFLRRVGTQRQKDSLARWEMIVRAHAAPDEPAMAANFATGKPATEEPQQKS